jgi:sporulation protein YlmC with PRC-barrel domain
MSAKFFIASALGSVLLVSTAFAQAPAPSAPSASAPSASSSAQGQWRVSKLVGVNVYNDSNEKLGSISELISDSKGDIKEVVIGVGGFLGMGQRDIAVPFEKLKWSNEPVRASTAESRPMGSQGSSSSTSSTGSSSTTGSSSSGAKTSDAKQWYPDHAVFSASKEQISSMPEFKY